MLIAVSRLMSTQTVLLHHNLAARLGLNATDHKVLDVIIQEGRVTAGQLAALTGLTTGAVTALIDRLERGRFVRREPDPQDRRKVYVVPLPDRMPEIQAFFGPMMRGWAVLLEHYSDEELAIIVRYLTEIVEGRKGMIGPQE